MGTLLPDGIDVDLWYVRSDEVTDSRLLARYRQLLSADETAQVRQFAFEKGRHQCLVTRALARTVLSHYAGGEPSSLEFARNAFGKPGLVKPAGLPLSFNLSHTAGVVACAVASGQEIGVDIEDTNRRLKYLPLARRFFAAAEASAVENELPEQRRVTFFRLWTLKEAYIKARGVGLSIPLDSFAFTLCGDRPPAVCFTGDCRDEPGSWQFAQIGLDERYRLALAVRLPGGHSPGIRIRQTIPLQQSGAGRMLPPCPAHEWTV